MVVKDFKLAGSGSAGAVRRTASAYQALRGIILSNEWSPGFQATEQEIADRLAMSRTPVREAMMRLQAEGLVAVVPRHGLYVLPVSSKDMQEIYEILTSLEATAAGVLRESSTASTANEPAASCSTI